MSKRERPKERCFSLRPGAAAKEVFLAGDFTNWEPVAMARREDGSFALGVSLRRGRYEYKYIVDGQWIVDPDISLWAANPFGSVNSVIEVG